MTARGVTTREETDRATVAACRQAVQDLADSRPDAGFVALLRKHFDPPEAPPIGEDHEQTRLAIVRLFEASRGFEPAVRNERIREMLRETGIFGREVPVRGD